MRSQAEVRTAVEAELRHSLDRLAAYAPHADLPGVELLDERTELAGPDFVPRSAFRVLPASTGWLGLSLPRESDRELVPALTETDLDTADPAACWAAVACWLTGRTAVEAEERAILLGLPAARIPDEGQLQPGRPPVLRTQGGRRSSATEAPLVVDLSSLWAGPLAARLLGLTGARIIKVESRSRPDGARLGPAAFYERLHPSWHESLVLDFTDSDDLARLRDLTLSADVVIEASRPRALRHLGIRAEDSIARGTVWCGITAHGRDEPNAMRVGFGDDVAAGAGLVARAHGRPIPVGDALADPLTGVVAAAAVVDALAAQPGALLDVSMHDVCLRAACRSPYGVCGDGRRASGPVRLRPTW